MWKIRKESEKMDYEIIKKRIKITTSRIKQLGGGVQEVTINEPSSLEQINEMEKKLGVELPKSFKKVLQEFSGSFNLRWVLPDELERPVEFREIFCGSFSWDLKSLPFFEKDRKESVEMVFYNKNDEYDKVWHNKLAFCPVGNGDYLAFDMKEGDDDASIVYLSHDDGDGHGYKLADNFIELIENWSRIGFVGAEDWQWIPFTKSSTSGIDPKSEEAKMFRRWLNLAI